MKPLGTLSLSLFLALWLIALPASGAQIYEWIDENGVRRFSNEPPPEGVEVIQKTAEEPYDPRADQQRMRQNDELIRNLERDRLQREADAEAEARRAEERESAEKARVEAENARLEAEQKAGPKNRHEKGTGEQKRRRRERAAGND